VLELVLQQQGRVVNDYSSKLNILLDPTMRADVASQLIYKQLLATMQANEQGIIDDIDSEFLHDYRVAVRRTRSALSQLKAVFPDDIQQRYREFFSWLGKITSVTRDLDVYLLDFNRLKNSLPVAMREHLNPLHDFLQQKRQHAQRTLAKQLHSTDYVLTLLEWEQILDEPLLLHPVATNAALAIKPLADKKLWKTYQRVMNEGEAINDSSPCAALHELRKTCKKLRYSIEFFQSLYAESKIKTLLKALKVLQEVLGNYQDCEVQEHNLRLFCDEMQAMHNAPVETFVAIEQLIQDVKTHKLEIRCHFAEAFASFMEEDFKALLKTD
jgi:CHAD domain-containing protein